MRECVCSSCIIMCLRTMCVLCLCTMCVLCLRTMCVLCVFVRWAQRCATWAEFKGASSEELQRTRLTDGPGHPAPHAPHPIKCGMYAETHIWGRHKDICMYGDVYVH